MITFLFLFLFSGKAATEISNLRKRRRELTEVNGGGGDRDRRCGIRKVLKNCRKFKTELIWF